MSCNRRIKGSRRIREAWWKETNHNVVRLQERVFTDHDLICFSDSELLTVALSYACGLDDDEQIANRLLENFGSLKAVLEARPEQLMKVEGMNRDKTGLLSLVMPMMRAWSRGVNSKRRKISHSGEAGEYCRKLLMGERVEKFFAIMLNAQCKVIGKRIISSGTLSEVNGYPRLVMEAALNYNAWGVVLCHNHPGGTCDSSKADIESTLVIQTLLEGVGIHVLDHIIVAGDKTYSMLLNGDIRYPFRKKPAEEEDSDASTDTDSREINKACCRSKDKEESEMPYDRKTFGVVISKLRVQKGLTQENLSGLAGIARSHLVALENGEKTAKLSTLWDIAYALELKPSELIRLVENEMERKG